VQVPVLANWLGIVISQLIGLWEASGLETDGFDERDPGCKAADVRVEHLILHFQGLELVLGGVLQYVTNDEHKFFQCIMSKD
jgi:hypothetical protein